MKSGDVFFNDACQPEKREREEKKKRESSSQIPKPSTIE